MSVSRLMLILKKKVIESIVRDSTEFKSSWFFFKSGLASI